MQMKFCEKELQRLQESLFTYKINIEKRELSAVHAPKDGILAVTDQIEDVIYAKKHNIAVIFYETEETKGKVSGVDMVVQGFEELDVEYLQLVYMRHHGLPWIIAKTERLCMRESIENDLDDFRRLYREEGMLDYLPDPELEGEAGREQFLKYIHSMYRFYNYGIWTLLEEREKKIIGRVGIENAEYQGENVLEIGYLIGKAWRRQGFAKEAVAMAERYASAVLEAEKLYAFIHPKNKASIALIRSLGYERQSQATDEGLLVWKKDIRKRQGEKK